jgi:hypothetical protein
MVPAVAGFFYSIQPVVIALVVEAVLRIVNPGLPQLAPCCSELRQKNQKQNPDDDPVDAERYEGMIGDKDVLPVF